MGSALALLGPWNITNNIPFATSSLGAQLNHLDAQVF